MRNVSLEDVNELYDFLLDRLRNYYADRGVPAQQFEAVAALRPASLLDFDRRLVAIGEFATLPEAEALAAANKRIRNILKKADGAIPATVDSSLFAEAAERELAAAVDAAIAETDAALAQRDYVAVLGRLARLRPQVDAFFDARQPPRPAAAPRRPPRQRRRDRAPVRLTARERMLPRRRRVKRAFACGGYPRPHAPLARPLARRSVADRVRVHRPRGDGDAHRRARAGRGHGHQRA
jgi:hypothetical protein